jgi:hypothetical protein
MESLPIEKGECETINYARIVPAHVMGYLIVRLGQLTHNCYRSPFPKTTPAVFSKSRDVEIR